jgi:hypothetical protein
MMLPDEPRLEPVIVTIFPSGAAGASETFVRLGVEPTASFPPMYDA